MGGHDGISHHHPSSIPPFPKAGVRSIGHRLWNGSWSQWSVYKASFSLIGSDGLWYMEFRAVEFLDNYEAVQNVTLIVDNTAPNDLNLT
jgi:hypothetical protein